MVGSGPHSREPRAWFRAAGMLFGEPVITRFTARDGNHTHARAARAQGRLARPGALGRARRAARR
eukprot:scaffold34796_cov63-Phaeocystis_antarctica.AAC.7